jgi:urease accessory protein
MLPTELSASAKPVQHRHIGAIAALIFISLLSSLSGSPADHAITNSWEGFLWGIADPVLSLDRLVSLVAIGLLIGRKPLSAASFVIAAILGIVINLLTLHLPGAEIAIATFSIAFGAMFMTATQPHWLIITLLAAIAGLCHGYAHGVSIIGAEILPIATYVLGITVTQYVILLSTQEIHSILPSKMHLFGLAVCAVGIVFLHNSIM